MRLFGCVKGSVIKNMKTIPCGNVRKVNKKFVVNGLERMRKSRKSSLDTTVFIQSGGSESKGCCFFVIMVMFKA